jgi:hypothetical protein
VGQSLPIAGIWAAITFVVWAIGHGDGSYVWLVVWIIASGAGYIGSLFTNPDRRCWGCNGTSRFFGFAFTYASRACSYCGGSGRRPRFGTRFVNTSARD